MCPLNAVLAATVHRALECTGSSPNSRYIYVGRVIKRDLTLPQTTMSSLTGAGPTVWRASDIQSRQIAGGNLPRTNTTCHFDAGCVPYV